MASKLRFVLRKFVRKLFLPAIPELNRHCFTQPVSTIPFYPSLKKCWITLSSPNKCLLTSGSEVKIRGKKQMLISKIPSNFTVASMLYKFFSSPEYYRVGIFLKNLIYWRSHSSMKWAYFWWLTFSSTAMSWSWGINLLGNCSVDTINHWPVQFL